MQIPPLYWPFGSAASAQTPAARSVSPTNVGSSFHIQVKLRGELRLILWFNKMMICNLYFPKIQVISGVTNLSSTQKVHLQEKLQFLGKFLRSPWAVGSVTPSSQFLTQEIMSAVPWDQVHAIAELGAGTGVFTRAIERLRSPDAQVLLFEQDPEMRSRLQTEFPTFHHYGEALHLSDAVQQLDLTGLDCIISGLPFTAFPKERREQLMGQILSALKPGGLFIAFQYSLHMLPQFRRNFDHVSFTFVPLNLPPAFVYLCRKR
jgi:phospholipid N-methyltransferase